VASVLIVDDDLRIQELLMRWLRAEGHTLRFAEDSNAALASIAVEQPAVIVCDVHMPGANGLWLADRVRAIAPTTAIVIATGTARASSSSSTVKTF
jgi:CheY-like chemotaxis protein